MDKRSEAAMFPYFVSVDELLTHLDAILALVDTEHARFYVHRGDLRPVVLLEPVAREARRKGTADTDSVAPLDD